MLTGKGSGAGGLGDGGADGETEGAGGEHGCLGFWCD